MTAACRRQWCPETTLSGFNLPPGLSLPQHSDAGTTALYTDSRLYDNGTTNYTSHYTMNPEDSDNSSDTYAHVRKNAEQFLQDLLQSHTSPSSVMDRRSELESHFEHRSDLESQAGWSQADQSTSQSESGVIHTTRVLPQCLGTNYVSCQLAADIRAKTQEVGKWWRMERHSTVLARIEEIPKQIGDTLQASAKNLVDDLHDDVDAVRNIIGGSYMDKRTELAVENIEAIPEMVHTSLQANVAKAEEKVRHQIDGVINELEFLELTSEHYEKEIWKILPIVQEAAHQAVGEAVQASKAKATQQFEYALAKLPESRALFTAKKHIVQKVPDQMTNTIAAARNTAQNQLEHVFAAVHDGVSAQRDVSNQVVADMLLRAKAAAAQAKEDVKDAEDIRPPEQKESVIPHAKRKAVHGARLNGSPDVNMYQESENDADRFSHSVRSPEVNLSTENAADLNEPASSSLHGSQNEGSIDLDEFRDSGEVSMERAEVNDAAPDGQVFETTESVSPSPWIAQGEEALNIGSMGHHDFCSRPCLYFASNRCSNGSRCSFCHLPHSKRPMHLDKRHREMLRKLPFTSRIALVFPILQEKLRKLDLGPESMQRLHAVKKTLLEKEGLPDMEIESFHDPRSELSAAQRAKRWRSQSLQVVLGAMKIRSLLLMLIRTCDSDDSDGTEPGQPIIDSLLQYLRHLTYVRHQTRAGQPPVALEV